MVCILARLMYSLGEHLILVYALMSNVHGVFIKSYTLMNYVYISMGCICFHVHH